MTQCLLIDPSYLLGADQELVVGAPATLYLSVWRCLLEKPHSEVGSWLETQDSKHFVVGFLSANKAHSCTCRPLITFNLFPACFIELSCF